MSRYIALASFPKSGNTFVRYFLNHLLFDGDRTAIANIYVANPSAGRATTARGENVKFYKTHDRVPSPDLSHAGYIHIIRHPLDVFLSWLNFLSTTVADYPQGSDLVPGPWGFDLPRQSVAEMIATGTIDYYFGLFVSIGTVRPNFTSRTGSWFANARAWSEIEGPIIRLRYEDLVGEPEKQFSRLAEWLQIDHARVGAALAATKISTAQDGKFFWRQQPLGYRSMLQQKHIDQYSALFGQELAHFGY